jgi:hypothetical protein
LSERWFKTSKWETKIVPMTAISSTEKTLTLEPFVNGRKPRTVKKRTQYESYFRTWEEARDFLIERSQRRLKTALEEVELAMKESSLCAGLPLDEV